MSSPLTLRPHLQLPYSQARYRTILEDILPSGTLKLLQTPQAILARCDDVTSTEQIGSIELPDGSTIALLEVHVADQVKLARNRVALRNFVARFIDEATTTAVLAVFHQAGKPDWRLTYACKRSQLDEDTLEITSTQTAPRRYTFLLGQHEPCRTAAGRLAELREKGEHLTLEELEKAFSVERLNKDFFKDYKKHYEAFVAHLLSPENAKATRSAFGIATHKEKADQDKADKPVRDFVKRLLGRLVFLHFLQKKGWMGCKAGSKAWTGGDSDFLATYFKTASAKSDAHRFHSRWLIPLFFDALNNAERPGDLFPPTGTRIPYLNGGLFETDPAALHALDFPAPLFEALLHFFGEYNFTIDENDPEDHEVGIDPEMLGHIFENLLEDNKDKGAYYTPKAIVSYMARQSLLHYLQTHLGEDPELGVLLNEKDFTRLEKNGFVHQNAKRIAELLDAVKICDPAIGSGAFPIGLLQEILWTQLTLDLTLNTPEERAKLKRRIIQNSIHGVDLDPGAVEIARLRFWLALVVDEEQPRPLPNLDYKIHRADSLIEYIRGEPVHLGKVSAEDKRTHKAIQSLIAAKAALFTAQKLPEKRAARFALYRALAEVAMAEFTWLRNEMGLIAGDAERAAQLDHGLKEFGVRARIIDHAAKESAKTQDRILAELRAWFDDDQKPTFLWQLHFGEVFANGGFDIVIANPPYVRQEGIKAVKPLLQAAGYECYTGTSDLLVYFYEKGVQLIRPGGSLCFITSNKFYLAAYGAKLRLLLTRELSLRTLIDFGDAPIFEALAYASILVGTKEPFKANYRVRVLPWQTEAPIASLLTALENDSFTIPQTGLLAEGWRLENPVSSTLLAKLRRLGKPLDQVVDGKFYNGVKPGHGGAFVVDGETRKRLIKEHASSHEVLKPYLRGRDLKRWGVHHADLWLIYLPWHFPLQTDATITSASKKAEDEFRQKYPAIYAHLRTFKSELELRDKAETGIRYEWYALARPRSEIQAAFESPKVILGRFMNKPTYAFEGEGFYHNNALSFIPTTDRSLVAFLNSSVCWWALKTMTTDLQNGYVQAQNADHARIPIPPASATDKARLSQLAEACAAAAQRGDDETLAVHEAEIDDIVYRLFDLTEDEITLVKTALAPTRSAAPARKRARAAAPAPISDAEAYEIPMVPAETRVQETSRIPRRASDPAWLPGELFNVEGELPAAKKARAAPEAAAKTKPASNSARINPEARPQINVPVDETERDEVLAVIREIFSTGGERDRETALREISQALGYERLGSRIREVLNRDIRTAVRRGILQNNETQLSLLCRSVQDYERPFLKELFLAAISQNGRVWLERDEAIRRFARWLGFRRTGRLIDESARSLINGLLRDGSLEKDGQDWIRRT